MDKTLKSKDRPEEDITAPITLSVKEWNRLRKIRDSLVEFAENEEMCGCEDLSGYPDQIGGGTAYCEFHSLDILLEDIVQRRHNGDEP